MNPPRPTLLQIVDSAAHLVAAIEDPKFGSPRFRCDSTKSLLHDSYAILKGQLEAIGAMADYPKDRKGRYTLGELGQQEAAT